LSDIGGVVVGFGQNVPQAPLIGIHKNFIDDHSGARDVFAGE